MKKKPKRNIAMLWQLFKTTFELSACTFGGGFVIVSLMKKKFVEELGWLDESEMLDITAIAQSSPGPIPINASVILGYRMQGIAGALTAVIGTALPPICIISIISLFYTQFRENKIVSIALQVMRAGVAAVICDVVINLAKHIFQSRNLFSITLLGASCLMIYVFGFSAMMIILFCLLSGIGALLFDLRKEKTAC